MKHSVEPVMEESAAADPVGDSLGLAEVAESDQGQAVLDEATVDEASLDDSVLELATPSGAATGMGGSTIGPQRLASSTFAVEPSPAFDSEPATDAPAPADVDAERIGTEPTVVEPIETPAVATNTDASSDALPETAEGTTRTDDAESPSETVAGTDGVASGEAAADRLADMPEQQPEATETAGNDDATRPAVPIDPETPIEPETSPVTDTQPVTDVVEAAASQGEDESTPLAKELTEITRRRRALASQKLPLPEITRVFTVANQKGGVGKTTSAVNLAAALARTGARVLVIDLDPQGNASTALGVEHRSETTSVYDVMINDEPMANVVQKSPEFDSLYCVPATIHLAGAEIELVSLVAREQRLRTALRTFLTASPDPFHYVFIDCPPSLGLLTINAFVAAREVLIPIQCEYYALEGLSQLLTNIQLIERHLNSDLTVSTILLTMYDSRTNLANQVAQEVRDHFPDQVLSTLIPRSVRISEAPSYGQSVISYDSNSSGSLSYLEAAAEIARRGVPN